MSIPTKGAPWRRMTFVCIAALTIAACDENGEFALPSAPDAAANDAPVIANAPNQQMTERDVERPDIFEVTDRGLWDGRPSLGGVWVAHPDVQDPERVVIRNPANGREITGALFRRERENPGPLLQVSSDAADELGILAGTPSELSVVAVRRVEVIVDVPQVAENPVTANLEAPVNVAAEPLAAASVEETAAEPAPVAIALPPAVEVATAAVEQTALAAADVATQAVEVAGAAAAPADAAAEPAIDLSAVFAPVTAPADGPRAQIGIYSVEANANAAVANINGAGIAAQVTTETMGGRAVWRVVAGPMVNTAVVDQLKALGYVDAFVIADAE